MNWCKNNWYVVLMDFVKKIVFFIKKDQKCRFYIFDSLKLPKIKISMSFSYYNTIHFVIN